jgi:hypothetical protein
MQKIIDKNVSQVHYVLESEENYQASQESIFEDNMAALSQQN